jgi:hypothetical protein
MAYKSDGPADSELLPLIMDSQCWLMLEILTIFISQPTSAGQRRISEIQNRIN